MSAYMITLISLYGVGVFLGTVYTMSLWGSYEVYYADFIPQRFIMATPIKVWETCEKNNFTTFGKYFCTGLAVICCLPIILCAGFVVGTYYFCIGLWKNIRPLFIKKER